MSNVVAFKREADPETRHRAWLIKLGEIFGSDEAAELNHNRISKRVRETAATALVDLGNDKQARDELIEIWDDVRKIILGVRL